ncbi:glycosyltransferase [Paenibacillus qinlingensis]|uniref:Glycosyltransferase involved in cell wall biosynthesis n=1 Tax=Paenibacillus qinlingensis TaxID=1837343 RepID=A0ABU1NXH9_9BACL|nr:glycosyltransferase [Paenibacillus qinlingensis]MDR6552207.1 glycosyltransferase involved in cell wall biosynthesis [Paenibacillus qinlingensis]
MKQHKILAILPALIPSTLVGIVKPLLNLDRASQIKFKVSLNSKYVKNDIDKYDVIVFCRNCEATDLELLYYARSKGKKIIYELDDNLFDISIDSELGKYHRFPGRLYTVKRFFELSDLVHVYSKPMLNLASNYNANVKKINSYFDFNLIKSNVTKRTNNKIKIVYATARKDNDELSKIFEKALMNIMEKYEENIEIFTFGEIPSILKNKPNIFKLNYIKDYNKFISFFSEQNFDIGLAPLNNDLFHRSKTNNKFREYGACEIAGIYSNIDVYSDCVEHYESGILVENTEQDWTNAISDLIENEKLRSDIIHNAKNQVQEKFSFESSQAMWKESILQLFEMHPQIKEFNFIGNFKVLLVVDKQNYYDVDSRINAFYEAAIFSNMKYDIIFLEHLLNNPNLIINYNISIFFFEKISDYNKSSISYMKFNKPVILDFKVFDEWFVKDLNSNIKKVSSSKITNIPSDKYDNLFLEIKNFSGNFENKRYTVEELFLLLNGTSLYSHLINIQNNEKDEMKKMIYSMPEQIEKNTMNFYSLDSPVIKWISVIEENALIGHVKKISLITKFYKKIERKFIVKLTPFVNRYKRINNKMDVFLLIFKINITKKYK